MGESTAMTQARRALREFLAENPYGGMSFKDRLATFEALHRKVFGKGQKTKHTEILK